MKGRDGIPYSRKIIEAQLEQVFKMADEADVAPVGILTWLPRDEWADAYNLLRQGLLLVL